MAEPELPGRYERLARLGKGGGGEVWSVRDRHSGAVYALKVLVEDASESERAALVREAVALSGLEGLGVPRVIAFGRLPGSGRAYLVRELVDGRSLEAHLEAAEDLLALLAALGGAADQLTVLHRAGLLHGDIKPANIILEPSGAARLVDLGLAAPWREGGTRAEGLTPRYAAPELLLGEPLTVRAEVYALGATLHEILERAVGEASASPATDPASGLREVVERAMARAPERRFPSADEFASALRRAARLAEPAEETPGAGLLWPIVGIDATSAKLLARARALPPGGVLRILGPSGSGRSALLRRLAWSLGVEGSALVWLEPGALFADAALDAELRDAPSVRGLFVLVDDADVLGEQGSERLRNVRDGGGRLVLVGGVAFTQGAVEFDVPPLDGALARDLVRRAIPSLSERSLARVVEATGCWPGELKRLLRRIDASAVAGDADIERALNPTTGPELVPRDPLERAVHYLDRGRYSEAREALDVVTVDDENALAVAVALARHDLGVGEPLVAKQRLLEVEARAERAPAGQQKAWSLALGRAHSSAGEYDAALARLSPLASGRGAIAVEAMAYQGFALALVGREGEALEILKRAVRRAELGKEPRLVALALACQGLVLQRADRSQEAEQAYRRAIVKSEDAGDAGLLAMLQLNLAGLLKVNGDIARAIVHFEAAVDMGRRSGRRATLRQALLNLANTDLYLGRLARVHAALDGLAEQKEALSPIQQAQLLGLRAEFAQRSGRLEEAFVAFLDCARAYAALGRGLDAAEARLEGILAAARGKLRDAIFLKREVELAEADLGAVAAHRPLHLVVRARLAVLSAEEPRARTLLDEAIVVAREAAQLDWVWRALEIRAELSEGAGQPLTARRDREEALAVLESIGGRLPRDLREVYWNDPPRRRLRAEVYGSNLGQESGRGLAALPRTARTESSPAAAISSFTKTPLEHKLARLLEINGELVGEVDLVRLAARIVDHAVELLDAERGFLVLRDRRGGLGVHTSRSRAGDSAHAEFSRSIAGQVIASGEPMVSLDAREDARFTSFSSVHQLLVQSVACAPVRARGGEIVGALYLETRGEPGAHFQRELPTLLALADQVAIAIENARLIRENQERAEELEQANKDLAEAEIHLRELLGSRTESLKRARRKLRSVRETLFSHFGYKNLVGTSAAMRRVYAFIERIKDTDVAVLISGESGTGKEMVARAIHDASALAAEPFLGINCGAVPEQLLESELFGHLRGAFTGADRSRKGLFRECDRGTVLLDEIGEMSQKMQTALLRVLQERKVRPLGGSSEEAFLGRVICATNLDLEKAVAEARFREDLYYRIRVLELRLPPLRERAEDIPQLVDHFLGIFALRYRRPKKTLAPAALRALCRYPWPGNVRQLENVLLNAWVLSDKLELELGDFDLPGVGSGERPRASATQQRTTDHRARARNGGAKSDDKRTSETARSGSLSQHRSREKERILRALRDNAWNRVRAAQALKMPRRTFYRRLRDYGLL